jgi:hypothetical protein
VHQHHGDSASLSCQPPTYRMLQRLCEYITQITKHGNSSNGSTGRENTPVELSLDPYDEHMTASLFAQYMSTVLDIVSHLSARYESPLPRITLRCVYWNVNMQFHV